ncbi:GHKL domain-containing protein [Tissierella sp. MB52-C2]|uniref:sensor histidine kinase n=1 Tax=Tissierella sp. MB52-C2 TaxID=3070999 RepID=UPI00280B2997|nr:ATP-binding protein [Tissierella sp. MB52-C2]WMM24858.1 GHKL domain-containing protein [Tissierella sp. MB52-C2]
MRLVGFFIMAIFDIINLIIISRKLVGSTKSNRKKIIIFILIFSVLMALSRRYLPCKYNILIALVLIMTIIFILYKQDIEQTIYISIICIIIILLIQFMIVGILQILFMDIKLNFTHGIIAQIMGFLGIILVSRYIPLNYLYRYVLMNNKVFKYITLNIFVLLVSMLLYWNIDIDGALKNIVIIAVISLGIIYVNFVLIKNGLKNEYEQQQLQTYEKYIPVIDELIQELRIKQHEFDNHIQALNMIIFTNMDYGKRIRAMENYMNDIKGNNNLGDLIKLDNKVLAGFLYSKIKNAEELGIQFEILIEDYGFKLNLKDYEIIETIGNLINNAFETDIENNVVILKLKKEKDMNVIEVRNKHPYLKNENINRIFNKGFSTKLGNRRGFGLYNIREIVKKYNGNIEIMNEIYNDDNYIIFRVLFVSN